LRSLSLSLNSITFSMTTYIIYKIIVSHRQRDSGHSGHSGHSASSSDLRILNSAIAFMACSWLLSLDLVFAALYSLFFFSPSDTRRVPVVWINTLSLALYLSQNYLFLIALFVRLSGLFKAGPLAMSRRTTLFYAVTLSLIPTLFIPNAIYSALAEVPRIVDLIWNLSIWMLTLFALSTLLALFTVKLQQIQKNKTLNAFIRRQMALAVLALVFVVLIFGVFCVSAARGQTLANHGNSASLRAQRVIMALFATFGNLCNFLCIAISYRCCDSLIVLCFGCIRCCRVIPITTADHDAIFLEQIMKNVPDRSDRERAPRAEGPSTRIQQRAQPSIPAAAGPPAPAAAAALPAVVPVAGAAIGALPAVAVQHRAAEFDIVYEY